MNRIPAAMAEDASGEIAALVGTLQETQSRLEELTAGGVDAVVFPGGQSYLLQRAQARLWESEEKFRQLADNITDVFWITSPDRKIMHYVSAGFERIWGRSTESLYADPHRWVEAILPEERERVFAVFGTLTGAATEVSVEYRIARPDGTVCWIYDRGFQIRDAVGKVVRLTGIATDITERKQAGEAMRESEERFAGAFEFAPIGMALVSPGGRWLKVNQALCRLVGYSEAELLARVFQDISHPEDREVSGENLRRLIAGEIRSFLMEKRYVHKRGNIVTTLLNVSLVRDGQGQPRYFVGQIQDITERKRTEESLRLLGSAVEQARESIVITDADLNLPGPRMVFVNPAFTQMTGYTAEDAIGKSPRILQGPRTDRTVLNRLRQNLERGEGFAGEAINYRKDGTEFTLEWQIAPLHDAGGKITHFVAIQRDVTARKQAELELEQTHAQLLAVSREAAMAEFATGILHNVGNVLNSVTVASTCVADSIRGSASANLAKVVALLQEHETDLGAFFTENPKGRQVPAFLAQLAGQLAGEQAGALDELARLQKNIVHVRDIVTMQQGLAKKSGTTEIVHLADLVEDALRMNLIEGVQHGIQVIKEFTDAPPVPVEKQKVLQILVNLVRNAQQSCEASGRPEQQLILHTTAANGHVRIAVRDNGVGIPPENLARMFSRGFTTKKHGHGFGLHGAAQAAKEMGGSLTVQSRGAGLGATFVLELPCQPPSGAHENSVP